MIIWYKQVLLMMWKFKSWYKTFNWVTVFWYLCIVIIFICAWSDIFVLMISTHFIDNVYIKDSVEFYNWFYIFSYSLMDLLVFLGYPSTYTNQVIIFFFLISLLFLLILLFCFRNYLFIVFIYVFIILVFTCSWVDNYDLGVLVICDNPWFQVCRALTLEEKKAIYDEITAGIDCPFKFHHISFKLEKIQSATYVRDAIIKILLELYKDDD